MTHSLSRPLYFPAQERNRNTHAIRVYADMIDCVALNPPKQELKAPNKRKIRGFSDASRHAMIEFLAKVIEVPDLFVTLTYSDDIVEYAYLDMHKHFETFRKRLERAYVGIRAMWRIEFVPRKSGRFIGQLKPHFHLLVWLPAHITEYQKAMILKDNGAKWRLGWHECVKSNDANHRSKYGCVVEPIKSRKHAYAYCSKYLAKETFENMEVGRRWGRIGQFEQPMHSETLLTEREYIHFKRLLNAYIKSKAPKFYKSFRRANRHYGCSVFGLGFISATKSGIKPLTVYTMLYHAQQLAEQEWREVEKSP